MFKRLTKKEPALIIEDDRFWLNLPDKFKGIYQEIAAGRPSGTSYLLITHFEETFHALTDACQRAGIPAQPYSRHLDSSQLTTLLEREGTVLLIAAEALTAAGQPQQRDRSNKPLTVLVAERHPLRSWDERIQKFVAQLPFSGRLIYCLALSEPLLRLFGSRSVFSLWQQLKLPEQEYLSTSMLTRVVQQAQEKIAGKVRSDVPAVSMEAWLENNLADFQAKDQQWPVDASPDSAGLFAIWLPLNCPSCAAELHPESVTWINVRLAQCPYCNIQIHKPAA